MKRSEIMWFIEGTWGHGSRPFLYYGGRSTRKDAVLDHAKALKPDGQTIEESWAACRARGDRPVKCRVTPCRRTS